MKISELREKVFPHLYLQIDTSRIDKFLTILDEDYDSLVKKYTDELQQRVFDQKALQEAENTSRVGFSLYALAILDCASILENNRVEILKRIPNLNGRQLKNVSRIEVVQEILTKIGIDHESVQNCHLAEEFRLVANKIKHARFSFSNKIKLDPPKKTETKTEKANGEEEKEGVSYDFDDLRELYKKRIELHDYLKDLFDKVNASNSV